MAGELWTVNLGVVEYREAWALQERVRAARQADAIPDTLLLLEHPPVYTRGRRSTPGELGAHVDVVPGPLEGEDARRLTVARHELGALLEGVEDAVRVGADLRDDQRVGHGDDGAIMG